MIFLDFCCIIPWYMMERVMEERKIIHFHISGMHCASCARTIERGLEAVNGVRYAHVDLSTEEAEVCLDPVKVTPALVSSTIEALGYTPDMESEMNEAGLGGDRSNERKKEEETFRRRFLLSALFGVPLMILAMGPHLGLMALPVNAHLMSQFALTTLIMLICGTFFIRGIMGAIKTKRANMDTLIALGSGAAYLYSSFETALFFLGIRTGHPEVYFEAAGVLLMFILLGKWIEARARMKVALSYGRLKTLLPDTAVVIRNHKETEIPIKNLVPGDIVLVKPGQKIPLDGVIVKGYSSINESMLTGESIPVDKNEGDKVFGGTLNGQGSFRFKVTAARDKTLIAGIVKTIRDVQFSKPPIQHFADRVSEIFVPAVVVIALVTFLIWFWLVGATFGFSLKLAIAVLVVSCPCALGLATPTAIMMGSSVAAHHGILIKNTEVFEISRKINTLVLDKTGTVTLGRPVVQDVRFGTGSDEKTLLLEIGGIENQSEHALGEAITEFVRQHTDAPFPVPERFKTIPGKGIQATVNGKTFLIGKKIFLIEHKVEIRNELARYASGKEKEGVTVVWVAMGNILTGVISLTDPLREDSKESVRRLSHMVKKLVLLSGDNQASVTAVGKELGIEDVIANVLPDNKHTKIIELQRKRLCVAMVGDGINDAPALAQADIAIAMGRGTDLALETADIVILGPRFRGVADSFEICRKTFGKIRQNMMWALGYNLIGIPLAAGVFYPFTGWLLTPVFAGAAMAFSSVAVVFNSLSLSYLPLFNQKFKQK